MTILQVMIVRLLSSLFIVGLFTGCLEEIGEINEKEFELGVSPEVALPVIDSRVFVNDFSDELDSVIVSTDPDGTIVLSYMDQLFSEVAENYFSVPGQTSPIVTFSGLSSGGMPLTGTIEETKSDILEVEPDNNERLDLVRLKGGTIRLVVNSSYTVNTDVTFDIPNLLIEGVPFNESISVAVGNNMFDYNLTNSTFSLVLAGSDFNKLAFDVTILLSANGDVVLPAQSLEAYFEILNPEFQLIVGESDFREIENQSGTEPINILQNLTIEDFQLEEPSLQILADNSFGVPFEIDIQSLSIKDRDNQTHPLTGDPIDNPQIFAAPPGTEIGTTVSSVIDINYQNSNLSDFLSNIPTEVSYAAVASYPGGTEKIFVLDTSKIEISANVRLPLYGRIMNLRLEKEFDFSGSVFDDAIAGSLLFNIENRFPLSLGLMVEFYDGTGTKILTLLQDDQELVPSASVDGDGRSTSPAVKEREIILTDEDIVTLRTAESIKVFILLETSDNGAVPVRILDIDYIDLKIAVKAEFQL